MNSAAAADSLTRRRATYRRSNTLASLPTDIIQQYRMKDLRVNRKPALDEEPTGEETIRLLTTVDDSPIHAVSCNQLSPANSAASDDQNVRSNCLLLTSKPSGHKLASSQHTLQPNQRQGNAAPANKKAKTFIRKSSCCDLYSNLPLQQQQQLGQQQLQQPQNLERSPSSSSNLFTKVKDRIVETMFQTSTEGPHWAAIVQERRQRAAGEYEARMSGYMTHRKEILEDANSCGDEFQQRIPPPPHGRTRSANNCSETSGCQMTTSGQHLAPLQAKREKARIAFRRRSISQDSYPQNLLLPKSTPLTNSDKGEGMGGIICSTDDFQAILQGLNIPKPRHKGSPTSLTTIRDDENGRGNKMEDTGSLLSTTGKERSMGKSDSKEASFGGTISRSSSNCSTRQSGGICYKIEEVQNPQQSVANRGRSSDELARQTSIQVPEVEYDENGQTWDVYGAEFDPEILGDAIQMHLQKMIEKKMLENQLNRQHQQQEESQRYQRSCITNERDRTNGRICGDAHPCFVTKLLCLFNKRGSS